MSAKFMSDDVGNMFKVVQKNLVFCQRGYFIIKNYKRKTFHCLLQMIRKINTFEVT